MMMSIYFEYEQVDENTVNVILRNEAGEFIDARDNLPYNSTVLKGNRQLLLNCNGFNDVKWNLPTKYTDKRKKEG